MRKSSLFTGEFYKTVERHLKDGGIFVQWLHVYEFNSGLLASMACALPYAVGIASTTSVFPSHRPRESPFHERTDAGRCGRPSIGMMRAS